MEKSLENRYRRDYTHPYKSKVNRSIRGLS